MGVVDNGVNYDEAGRLRDLRMPHGTDLWRRQGYHSWTGSSSAHRVRFRGTVPGHGAWP